MTSQDDSMTSQDEVQEEAPKSGVSRRQFLTVSSAAIAALAIPGRANADSTSSQLPSQEILGPAVRSYSGKSAASQVSALSLQPFKQPELWNPKDQQLPPKLPDLVAQEVITQYPGGNSPIKLRSYSGHTPGPTLYLNAGEQINFTLCNNLNPRDNNDVQQNVSVETQEQCNPLVINNVPNCFSTTNMHFHGFHVSPKGESDNVLLDVYPNTTQSYSVQVPSNHAPGTHWYHSHRHGSTGVQVSNGMAGALIIKEPSGQEIVKEDQDIVWLIQELNSLGDADANDTTLPDYAGSAIYKGPGGGKGSAYKSTFMVNGVLQPLLKMETGTMQRWRLINASSTPGGFMQLVLCKCNDDPEASCDNSTTYNNADRCPMHLIAVDGISFYGKKPYQYPCNPQESNLLVNLYDPATGNFQFSPGNRADFLILPSTEGMYKLIKLSYKTKDGNIVGAQGAGVDKAQVLAYVQVTKGNGQDTIPPIINENSSQYPYLKPIADADIVKPALPNNPTINDLSSCPTPPDSFIPDLINNKRIFVFQACTTDKKNRQFVIDEQLMDTSHDSNHNNTIVTAMLGTAEEWILDNQAGNVLFGPSGQSAPHPFHIHVNPFQVVATGTKSGNTVTWSPVNNPIWQDTVAVEPNLPLKIRHRFDDFDGLFVMHCHILLHEDQGMMYMVNIENKSQTA